jgi:hypothetical protein
MTKARSTPSGDRQNHLPKSPSKSSGNFPAMFKHRGWPERGADMMRKVQTRVPESYGSVRAFEDPHGAESLK